MLRARASDDRGFAMAAVLGIAALITVVAVGGFWLASQANHESVFNRGETKAFQVANSGLELELASFDPANVDAHRYPYLSSTPDGNYRVECRQLNTWEYLMTSVGYSQGSSETVTQRFMFMDLWNMNIAAGNNAEFGIGNNWNGNASITGPFYVRGDFAWQSGNPSLVGGPLMVKDGAVDMSGGSGQIGSSSDPVRIYATNGVNPSSEIGTSVFPLNGIIYPSVPDIALPLIDDEYLDNMMQRAMDQSTDDYSGSTETSITESVGGDPATYEASLAGRSPMAATSPGSTSDYYKYRGASGGRGALGAGTHDLDIGPTSFGAWDGHGYAAGSGLHDDFAYDAANHILYLEGTVFIDGDVTFTTWVNYRGNGTLVVNGDIHVESGDVVPDGGFAVDRSLGLVCPGNIYIDGCTLKSAVYTNGELSMDHPATTFEGTCLAQSISGEAPNVHLTQNPIIKDILPESMPAVGGVVFPSTWTRH